MNIALLDSNKIKAHDPIVRPFTLKKLVLRNRVVSTCHASVLDDGGLPLERYQRYHEEKARGGVAMAMVGGSAMPSPDSSWGGGQLNMSSDEIVPHLTALAARIHAHGAAIIAQISHLGRRATGYGGNWLPVIAPSRIRETRNRNFPREMDEYDIRRVITEFVEAALRCRDSGLDGVETHTGGHLIGQFLSPLTNKRNDSFGGSMENRARFGLMVHEALRKALGDDFVIGSRYVIDEGTDGGLTFEEAATVARMFENEGLIDYFNCIYGRIDSELHLSEDNMPGMFQKGAPFLDKVAAFRKEVSLPIIHAAGVRDVATARYAISEGIVDLIGMTRAHMADPHIVNKVMRGEEERIRPCVGATYCLYKKAHCIHNPATGREISLSHTIKKSGISRRVVVVGGGPAGLEAARVCTERGHRVTVFEAADKLGGQILIAARVRERRDLLGIVDWRVSELERLGADIRLNSYVTASEIADEVPDVVIVATGGIPDTEFIEGGEHCNSVWDLLTGSVPARKRILIYDGTGRQASPSLALELVRKGIDLKYVALDEALALEMPYPDKFGFRKRFAQQQIHCTVDLRLTKVELAGGELLATFNHELSEEAVLLRADQVVVDNGTLPVDEVFTDLRENSLNSGITNTAALLTGKAIDGDIAPGSGFTLHRIGDAIASRDIYTAIQDAYRLCSNL